MISDTQPWIVSVSRAPAAALIAACMCVMVADATAQAPADVTMRCPPDMPTVVAGKRQLIREAATRRDWPALGLLAGRGFQWDGYEEGDPVPAWRDAAARGQDPARPLLAVLDMPCVVIRAADGTTTYVWPSAVGIDWKALDAGEKAALQAFYGARIDQYWVEGRGKGYYVGWSVGIDARGAWKSFTIGD